MGVGSRQRGVGNANWEMGISNSSVSVSVKFFTSKFPLLQCVDNTTSEKHTKLFNNINHNGIRDL